jgi:hypothetical protein
VFRSDRGDCCLIRYGIPQRAARVLKASIEQAPFGAHSTHVIERVPKAPFAQSNDTAQFGDGNRRAGMRSQVRFRSLDGLAARRPRIGAGMPLAAATD